MENLPITSFVNLQTIAKSLISDISIDSLLLDNGVVDDACRYKRSEDSYDCIAALIPVLEELYKYRPLPF